MWNDPIVEETRAIRDQLAAKFNYDLRAMGAYYQRKPKTDVKALIVKLSQEVDSEKAKETSPEVQSTKATKSRSKRIAAEGRKKTGRRVSAPSAKPKQRVLARAK